MIIKTSTGVLLHGTLAKDPEIRNAGQKQVLKFDIKAHSVKNAAGNWEGLYVQVNVWHGLATVFPQPIGIAASFSPETVY